MDKLDSFLNAVDDDPNWSSDEEDPISKRLEQEASSWFKKPSKEGSPKPETTLTFEDVFGSPIKKKSSVTPTTLDGEFFEQLRKTEVESNNEMKLKRGRFLNTGSMDSPSAPSPSSCKDYGSPSNFRPNSSNPDLLRNKSTSSSDALVDPHSRISLFRSSINLYSDPSMSIELALKERNLGIQYVNLMAFENWYKTNGGKDSGKKFWTTGVLVRKVSKRSGNGNDYSIWELNDLKDVQKPWSLFLFGTSSTASVVTSIPVGSVIDVITPSVMTSNNGPLKLSVNTSNQIRHIATARYFGLCSGKRKDGTNCTSVVNIIECPVCVYHASGELRKINGKLKGGKTGLKVPQAISPAIVQESQEGIKTVCFGPPAVAKARPRARMELQGGTVSSGRHSIRLGNPSSVSFEQNKIKSDLPPVAKATKAPLRLDPAKTKHLTEKDREIIESLGSKQKNSDLPEILAKTPNAGARNFLQYMSEQQYKIEKAHQQKINADQVIGFGKPMEMNQTVLASMKKALSFVRSKGPITKKDPNKATVNREDRKRKLAESPSSSDISSPGSSNSVKKRKNGSSIEVEFDFESDEIKKLMNTKSKHEKTLEDMQQEEYFDKLEKKEAIENKLLNTFSIETTAVMCRQCKYVALGKSDLCKQQNHITKTVKATKRFFKCKDCGNRTMSLDRLPSRPCKKCNSSSWLPTSVGIERKGPTLDTETLCVRGDEESFLGSSSAKLYLSNVSC